MFYLYRVSVKYIKNENLLGCTDLRLLELIFYCKSIIYDLNII